MSLFKQLWLSIVFLMSLAFIGSFVASFISAKSYLEEQLYQKNIDNASSLALTLSSKAQDNTIIELFINSQFDTGHYQLINLVDIKGNTIVSKIDDRDFNEAPEWIISWFPINVKPGVAQLSNGWTQIGTLTLASNTRFAYKQLWSNAKNLLYYFIIISIAGGVVGSVLLRWLTVPLHKTVDHAQAIGERRFITTEEPKTLEFKAVIRSMNKLSLHVKTMLEAESSKLEKWRMEMQHDEVSGLLNREPTLNHLSSFLAMENENAGGAIVLLRIVDLFELNQKVGRKSIDNLLKRFGDTFTSDCEKRTKGLGVSGRLNGSDFIVILPASAEKADVYGREIFENMNRVCRELDLNDIRLLASSTAYHHGEQASHLLTRLDAVLASAKETDTDSYIFADPNTPSQCKINSDEWASFLSSALSERRFILQQHPVYSESNELIFFDSSIKLTQADNTLLSAGLFMPHVSRLNMGAEFNVLLVELAIKELQEKEEPLCISLSAGVLAHPKTMGEISEMIQSCLHVSDKLWIDLPEYGVFQNIDGFRSFCQLMKPLNCKVGIGHVRQEALHLGELHDLGLDYVKIDSSLIRKIDETTSYQVFLRGLCTIVHSIGLIAIADGVANASEWKALKELGIDGGSGDFLSKKNDG